VAREHQLPVVDLMAERDEPLADDETVTGVVRPLDSQPMPLECVGERRRVSAAGRDVESLLPQSDPAFAARIVAVAAIIARRRRVKRLAMAVGG
jgi:hypothetical protein